MRSAMEAIIKPYNSYSYSSKKVSVLDFMDRCCCRYTPIILSILMLIISGKIDMFDKPINCMLPNEFSESWSSYVHQFCYVTGTYIKDYDHHGNVKPIYVGYYQWVPFILIIQAIAMRLPYFFWRFGQSKTDIDFGHVHALGNKIRSDDGGNRAKAVKEAANYIYNIAELREFKGLGQMIVFFHIAFKLMNVFMIGLMIYFLTVFIGYRNPFWGFSLARQAWPNHEYSLQQNQPLTYFPRIAYCKFSMDFLGNSVDGMVREVRCTLGINMLNEKVFLFLYFWYYALLVMVIMDAFFFARFLSSFKRIQCVKDLLHLVSRDDPFDEKKVVRFCQRVLGHDGLLIFRFIHQNFGKLIAMEICAQLYHVDITKHSAGHTNAAHCSTEGAGTTSTSPTIPMDTLIEQIEASNEPASISLQH